MYSVAFHLVFHFSKAISEIVISCICDIFQNNNLLSKFSTEFAKTKNLFNKIFTIQQDGVMQLFLHT